ncbi:MAG: putative glycerol-3-phosphate acyltransferase [Hyphomonas sp. TMED17]|nr:MAG: acyl-phosphate glycerol 3-phosphate acyltransferase [Hyphomonas sp. TMED17]CAI8393526.1 MAG: putative glycerol-3-phosphate acyltransferase [Hyphomonas sp. TMED17]
MDMNVLLAVLGGYTLGAIPFGLLITRLAGLGDIRDIGSGNIGATNVLRTGRKELALATLLLDSFKAGLAVIIFGYLFDNREIGLLAGASALIGHCYPVWLGFKGGKGVATYVGLLLFASLKGFIVGGPIWIAVFAITRISSLAALSASAVIPVGAYMLGETPTATAILAILSGLIFWTHRENIHRLIKGEEPSFHSKS